MTADRPLNRSGFPTVSFDGTEPREVIAAMRSGGHIILLRHALTDYSTRDSDMLGDRARQRTLFAEGQARARGLG